MLARLAAVTGTVCTVDHFQQIERQDKKLTAQGDTEQKHQRVQPLRIVAQADGVGGPGGGGPQHQQIAGTEGQMGDGGRVCPAR
jgi:hypothetical protein